MFTGKKSELLSLKKEKKKKTGHLLKFGYPRKISFEVIEIGWIKKKMSN